MPFCPFVKTKIIITFSVSWWSGDEKYFCFLFMVSCVLLQRYAKFNRPLSKDVLICYSCLYHSSMAKSFLIYNVKVVLDYPFPSRSLTFCCLHYLLNFHGYDVSLIYTLVIHAAFFCEK